MANINALSYARQIAQSLDSKDQNVGDEKIEASIWNKFVADKGGNTIKQCITFDNAIKSIALYLERNAKSLGKSVEALASEWLGKNVSKDDGKILKDDGEKQVEGGTQDAVIKNEDLQQSYEDFEKNKAEAKRKYKEAKQIADNERSSNGLTYSQAEKIISGIRSNTLGAGRVFVAENENDRGSWKTLSDEQFIEQLEKICNLPGYNTSENQRNLRNYKMAYAAKCELKAKYPILTQLHALKQAATEYVFEDGQVKVIEP